MSAFEKSWLAGHGTSPLPESVSIVTISLLLEWSSASLPQGDTRTALEEAIRRGVARAVPAADPPEPPPPGPTELAESLKATINNYLRSWNVQHGNKLVASYSSSSELVGRQNTEVDYALAVVQQSLPKLTYSEPTERWNLVLQAIEEWQCASRPEDSESRRIWAMWVLSVLESEIMGDDRLAKIGGCPRSCGI